MNINLLTFEQMDKISKGSTIAKVLECLSETEAVFVIKEYVSRCYEEQKWAEDDAKREMGDER